MNQLYFDNKPWKYIRFGIRILTLLASLSLFMDYIESYSSLKLLLAILFAIVSAFHFTNDFGTSNTFIKNDSGLLTIKWYNRIRPLTITLHDIDCITLGRKKIIVNLKTGKILKLNLSVFRTEQKRDTYKFFIDVADSLHLNIIKSFTGEEKK